MKVFISWSGNKSQHVARVFRDWLPSVIQSIEPYVSSEDIDKGARWSTDIAKELEDSTFGILCVTRENLDAPWISFEAGALSKTVDKSFVTPFLFDIKRSEVDGPMLQFQSTVFEKDDIKKLLHTLNKACGESGISDVMLDKAFEVWYPTLEKELNALHDIDDDVSEDDDETDVHTSEIIEEILELSRDNQKLLRNPDGKIIEGLEEVKQRIDTLLSRFERNLDERRISRKSTMMLTEELVHGVFPTCSKQYVFLILINMFKDDFPWIHSMGMGLVDLLRSSSALEEKLDAINSFRRLLDFSWDHSARYVSRKYGSMAMRETTMMMRDSLLTVVKEMEQELYMEQERLLQEV